MKNIDEITCENYVVTKLLSLEKENKELTDELNNIKANILEEIETRVKYRVNGKLSRIKALEKENEKLKSKINDLLSSNLVKAEEE